MKKLFVVLIALTVLGSIATAQVALSDFQDSFQTFATDMASVLAVSSTTGNIWSHAYVGGFPHLGVGLAVGANLVPADSVSPLFAEAGATLPAELQEYGIPIPAAALSFKIGIPFLKMDVGVKGGLIPDSVSESLSSNGVTASYQTMGVNVRYALLQDKLIIPAVSIGAAWNYVKGAVAMSSGIGSQTFEYTVSGGTPYDGLYAINVTDPDMDLEWEANTFDFTLQASKKLLIFTPYAGAGLTLGKSTVRGGMAAAVDVDRDGSDATEDEIAALEQAAGISIDDQGFLVSAESTRPVFRIYGGTSINILIVKIDLMANYVPASQSFGAQAMLRVQL